jgi:hypothetical protein
MDNMISLFEYLGKAAGGHLGKEVYLAARAKNVNYSQRKVSTKTYTGDVMIYPKSFLDEYFNPLPPPPADDSGEDGDDLPF